MINPYEAPKYPHNAPKLDATTPEDDLTNKLASRWLRLWGALLDALLVGIPATGLAYLLGFYDNIDFQGTIPVYDQIMLGLIGMGGFLFVNAALIYNRGQTIGKLICKTKVVTLDGKQVSGNRYLFLRIFPLWIINQIPIIGGIIALINALLIFRQEKNCLHDDIAQTRVIKI
jgi:uncharacterized RDD family membrane protein YckC